MLDRQELEFDRVSEVFICGRSLGLETVILFLRCCRFRSSMPGAATVLLEELDAGQFEGRPKHRNGCIVHHLSLLLGGLAGQLRTAFAARSAPQRPW